MILLLYYSYYYNIKSLYYKTFTYVGPGYLSHIILNYNKRYINTDYITFPGDQNIYTYIVVFTLFFFYQTLSIVIYNRAWALLHLNVKSKFTGYITVAKYFPLSSSLGNRGNAFKFFTLTINLNIE